MKAAIQPRIPYQLTDEDLRERAFRVAEIRFQLRNLRDERKAFNDANKEQTETLESELATIC